MMMVLGVICIFVGLVISFFSSNCTVAKRRVVFLLQVVLFGLAVFFTRYAPHIAVIGAIAIILSLFRLFDAKQGRSMLLTGVAALSAGVAFVAIDLFQMPTQDSAQAEKRDNYQPQIVTAKPQDFLSLEWSTKDTYADWPVAGLMCRLCKIAYESPTNAEDRIKEEFGWNSQTITAGSMQGYVVDADDDAIVVLRGTENQAYDIAQDLIFIRSKTPHGGMHGGFSRGYESMHDQVRIVLEKFKSKRVWITGHSLGGGMSIACAYHILRDGKYEIAGVMTFGQPKVVLRDMAKYLQPQLDGRYVFFVNDMDPVTRLVAPYEHFGHMVLWNDTDILRSKPAKMVYSSGPDSPENQSYFPESGYIEDLSDEELEKLIENPMEWSEHSEESEPGPNGEQKMYGSAPDVADHSLDAYQRMLTTLHELSTRKEASQK